MKKSLADILDDKKRNIIGRHMAGDVDNLARLIKTVSSLERQSIDITMAPSHPAVEE